MSQWPKWLRRQYGKLEICGLNPGFDTNFFSKINMNFNYFFTDFMVSCLVFLIKKQERPRSRWEYNVKMDLKEVGCDAKIWMNLARDRDQW